MAQSTVQAAWSQVRSRATQRARRWARRRQGPDAARLTLASERIYILPTAAGLVYAVMLATMLAGSMNYNNNMAFALTFLLAATGIVTIYHTHRMLVGLRLACLGAEPVFAGDPLEVRITLANDDSRSRDEIFLDWDGATGTAAGLPPLSSRSVALPLATHRRGPRALPALRISTRAPLGLTRAWTWVHFEERPIVYPRPADAAPTLRPQGHGGAATAPPQPGDEDFAGLRSYRAGDSPRRIAWRSYARTGQLLARDYRGGNEAEPAWLDWDALPEADEEMRIAWLARMVIDAHAAGYNWGLRVPGLELAPAAGRAHLDHCLRALALLTPQPEQA